MAGPNIEGLREPLRSIVLKIMDESGGRVTVTPRGGARTYEDQVKLYNDYLAGGNLAAKPGHSLHEHGMAVDFGGDLVLAKQLASKYGLVNSVRGEPWHFSLGNGQGYDDDPDFENAYGIQYNLNHTGGPAATPESVLANRIQAITRILGQDMSGAPGPGGIVDVMDDASPYTSVQNAPPTSDTTQFIPPTQPTSISGAAAVGAGAGGASGLQRYAHSLFGQYGFDDSDLQALVTLWNKESNWNPNAANPHSTARGIAQKMTSIHGPIESTPEAQIKWGLDYIKRRYGSPSNALAFHLRNNWY